jgi:hypothetical protein
MRWLGSASCSQAELMLSQWYTNTEKPKGCLINVQSDSASQVIVDMDDERTRSVAVGIATCFAAQHGTERVSESCPRNEMDTDGRGQPPEQEIRSDEYENATHYHVALPNESRISCAVGRPQTRQTFSYRSSRPAATASCAG